MSKFKIGDKVKETSTGGVGVISHRPSWADPDNVPKYWYVKWETGSSAMDTRYIKEDYLELVTGFNLKYLLTNGRRVKLRNGKMYTVVDGALIRPVDTELKLSWVSINDSGKDLLAVNPKDPAWDVMEVYEKPRLVVEYFEYYAPTEVIWQREEKTSKQLQLEALQKQAQDVVDAIKKLQDEE